ncbi:MAG: ADP-forming succinate--CoA ligase subunit beta [Deltaproteobacteria bacterium]|nr:ADP-forming succinate--CoA ligase subunit beta [Deltaproteobacteria bacterium]
MNIHEYQAKQILRRFAIPVPRGRVAITPQEAGAIARELGGACVVKAQIHAGGRGKAGGVKLAANAQATEAKAAELLGNKLVTYQTGPKGRIVRKLLVEEGLDIDRELYLGVVLDRSASRPSLIASSEGGVEIEEIARKSPEKIFRELVDPAVGWLPFQGRRLAYRLGARDEQVSSMAAVLQGLARAFVDLDCSLVEINPLVATRDGKFIALDAKMNFDNNALYRQPQVSSLRDLDEEDPREIEASRFGLSYISLEGNIGCMVNGAGLAMATMDIIKLHGGEPANFLDVGGGATTERVTEAFRILLSDRRVQGVLVNIFGGIMRCDVIAQGIVEAARGIDIRVPMVVRLQGTNVGMGKRILGESGLAIIPAETMAEAAEKIVKAVRG